MRIFIAFLFVLVPGSLLAADQEISKLGTLRQVKEGSACQGLVLGDNAAKVYLEEVNDRQICLDNDPRALQRFPGDLLNTNVKVTGIFESGVLLVLKIEK